MMTAMTSPIATQMMVNQYFCFHGFNNVAIVVVVLLGLASSFTEGWISSTSLPQSCDSAIVISNHQAKSIHPPSSSSLLALLSPKEKGLSCSSSVNHNFDVRTSTRKCNGFCLFASGNSDNESFSDDNADEDDDDDDDDVNELVGDWRAFRNKLAMEESSSTTTDGLGQQQPQQNQQPSSSKENQELLQKQNKNLANEEFWAHVTSSVEVGGLLVRMPLEMELAHLAQIQLQQQSTSPTVGPSTLAGRKLAQTYAAKDANRHRTPNTSTWYDRAQKYMQEQLQKLSALGGGANGKTQSIDIQKISPEQEELLQLYIDSHSHWQEVCLVVERAFEKKKDEEVLPNEKGVNDDDDELELTTRKVALVLNRPMALKMGNALAQLILYGAMGNEDGFLGALKAQESGASTNTVDPRQLIFFLKFVNAFQKECGVYVGGRDHQEEPATVIHGHKSVPDAIEIAPNVGIYMGGDMEHIVEGIMKGTYQPLDFRFFVGCHDFSSPSPPPSFADDAASEKQNSSSSSKKETQPPRIQLGSSSPSLDLAVLMGKYQPVACSRTLALKQCIGLPKPLWHETLDLCGGDMAIVSQKEMSKRLDMDQSSGTVKVQIFDKDDNDIRPQENDVVDDKKDKGDDDDVIVDQLNELFEFSGDEEQSSSEQQGKNGGSGSSQNPFYDDGSSAFQ